MLNNWIRCAVLLVFSAGCSAQSLSDDHQFITVKIAQYMLAFERCEQQASARGLPPETLLNALKQYDAKDVEKFLIIRSAHLRQECEKPASTDLAYAIVVMEGADVSEETGQAISAIKTLAFGRENWEFQRLYGELPEAMRQALEEQPYFQQPFEDSLVMNALQAKPPEGAPPQAYPVQLFDVTLEMAEGCRISHQQGDVQEVLDPELNPEGYCRVVTHPDTNAANVHFVNGMYVLIVESNIQEGSECYSEYRGLGISPDGTPKWSIKRQSGRCFTRKDRGEFEYISNTM